MVVAVLAVAVLAVALAGWLLRPAAQPGTVDTSTAVLFGRQVGLELPAPVTEADCRAALAPFPGIARAPGPRAAFVSACLHPRQ